MNDILSMIIGNEKLFEFYSSMQGGLGEFLRYEKFLREKSENEIKGLIEREASRKKQAVDKIVNEAYVSNYRDSAVMSMIVDDIRREQANREMIAQDILRISAEEDGRRKSASMQFEFLVTGRYCKDIDYKNPSISKFKVSEEIDFPKIYKPR